MNEEMATPCIGIVNDNSFVLCHIFYDKYVFFLFLSLKSRACDHQHDLYETGVVVCRMAKHETEQCTSLYNTINLFTFWIKQATSNLLSLAIFLAARFYYFGYSLPKIVSSLTC